MLIVTTWYSTHRHRSGTRSLCQWKVMIFLFIIRLQHVFLSRWQHCRGSAWLLITVRPSWLQSVLRCPSWWWSSADQDQSETVPLRPPPATVPALLHNIKDKLQIVRDTGKCFHSISDKFKLKTFLFTNIRTPGARRIESGHWKCKHNSLYLDWSFLFQMTSSWCMIHDRWPGYPQCWSSWSCSSLSTSPYPTFTTSSLRLRLVINIKLEN